MDAGKASNQLAQSALVGGLALAVASGLKYELGQDVLVGGTRVPVALVAGLVVFGLSFFSQEITEQVLKLTHSSPHTAFRARAITVPAVVGGGLAATMFVTGKLGYSVETDLKVLGQLLAIGALSEIGGNYAYRVAVGH